MTFVHKCDQNVHFTAVMVQKTVSQCGCQLDDSVDCSHKVWMSVGWFSRQLSLGVDLVR